MPYKGVFFDLDGTLADTAPELADGLNCALKHLQLQQVKVDLVRDLIGHGAEQLFINALARLQEQTTEEIISSVAYPQQLKIFRECYSRHCASKCELYPGAKTMLKELREGGIHLALITNKEKRYTYKVLDFLAITPYFSEIICGDTLPQRKPHPAGLLNCLRRYSLNASQAVYIGDSDTDVKTAKAAMMPIWAVTHGYNHGIPIGESKPDKVLEKLQDISGYIFNVKTT